MKTRILMSASAVLLGAVGVALSFLPQELLVAAGMAAEPGAVILAQVLGAAYLGFAMLNWMARGVLIGGVYARPVALGNFLHFAVVAIVLVKALVAEPVTAGSAVAAGLYVLFAVWFGGALFTHPAPTR